MFSCKRNNIIHRALTIPASRQADSPALLIEMLEVYILKK